MIAKIYKKKKQKNINKIYYIIIHSCEMSCSFLCTLEANKKNTREKRDTQNNKKEKKVKKRNKKEKSQCK